jgi:hypothetical protein
MMVMNTACYTFAPVRTGAAPAVGSQVRVKLSAQGASDLAAAFGPGTTYAFGMLNERRADGTIVVGVDGVERVGGARSNWAGANVVTFMPVQVDSVDVKQINRSKTRAAAIGGGLGILAIFALALSAAGVHGQSADGGTQPPP